MLRDEGQKAASFAHGHTVLGAPRSRQQGQASSEIPSQPAQFHQSRREEFYRSMERRYPHPTLPGDAIGCPQNTQTRRAGKRLSRGLGNSPSNNLSLEGLVGAQGSKLLNLSHHITWRLRGHDRTLDIRASILVFNYKSMQSSRGSSSGNRFLCWFPRALSMAKQAWTQQIHRKSKIKQNIPHNQNSWSGHGKSRGGGESWDSDTATRSFLGSQVTVRG